MVGWGVAPTRDEERRHASVFAILIAGAISFVVDNKLPLGAPEREIWDAAGRGDTFVLRQHIAAGADLNARHPKLGDTPLGRVTILGQERAAWVLLEGGADIGLRDDRGSTPLHVAAFFGHEETARILLFQGADPEARNNDGMTPLETVAFPWDPGLEKIYRDIAEETGIDLDLERIKKVRPVIAQILRDPAAAPPVNSPPGDEDLRGLVLGLAHGISVSFRADRGGVVAAPRSAGPRTALRGFDV